MSVMTSSSVRAALVVIVLVACGGGEPEPEPAQVLCELPDGRAYKPGDLFPHGDGCNGCHCYPEGSGLEPGAWACTLVGCPDRSMAQACEPVEGTGCALGPACGGGCCGQGERCVDGVCMCGTGPACPSTDICGASAPLGGDGCGMACCPPEGPC